MTLEKVMGTTRAQNGHNLGTKAKRQHHVGVYLRGEPRIYWLREEGYETYTNSNIYYVSKWIQTT